jgi:hypothetical protein
VLRPRIMKHLLIAFLVLAPLLAFATEPVDVTPTLGTWEGESKCTVANSPCHDEHVVYHIAADKTARDKVRIDGYNVLDGKQEFMETLNCQYRVGQILFCTGNSSKKDFWEFRILRDRMIGSLVVGDERILYRRLSLRKK